MILGMPARILAPPPPSSPWIVGQIGTASDRLVMVSPDGINWSTAPTYATGLTANLTRLVAHDGLIIVSNGSGNRYSLDGGVTWGNTSGLGANTVNGLTKSGSYWIASGLGGSSNIYRSLDGITWTAESTAANLFEAIFFNSAAIVGTSSGNSRRSADDGDTWATASVAGLTNVGFLCKTSTHIIAGGSDTATFIRRSTTGAGGSYSSVVYTASSKTRRGMAANSSGEVLIVEQDGTTWYSTNHGASFTAGATIPNENNPTRATSDTRNDAAYGDGAWIVSVYDESTDIARLYRATSPAGPWTNVATFSSNGAPLTGAKYIGP